MVTNINQSRRYDTVAVHYNREVLYGNDNGRVRMIKWFSDTQMAWHWIRERLNTFHRDEWAMNSFLQSVSDINRQWNVGDGEDGVSFAENLDVHNYEGEYRVYYKPTVDYDEIPEADREQCF